MFYFPYKSSLHILCASFEPTRLRNENITSRNSILTGDLNLIRTMLRRIFYMCALNYCNIERSCRNNFLLNKYTINNILAQCLSPLTWGTENTWVGQTAPYVSLLILTCSNYAFEFSTWAGSCAGIESAICTRQYYYWITFDFSQALYDVFFILWKKKKANDNDNHIDK